MMTTLWSDFHKPPTETLRWYYANIYEYYKRHLKALMKPLTLPRRDEQ